MATAGNTLKLQFKTDTGESRTWSIKQASDETEQSDITALVSQFIASKAMFKTGYKPTIAERAYLETISQSDYTVPSA